jgi:hypothetical protein
MNTFVVGYIVVWASVVLYVGSMARRQHRLIRQYEELRRQYDRVVDQDAARQRAA